MNRSRILILLFSVLFVLVQIEPDCVSAQNKVYGKAKKEVIRNRPKTMRSTPIDVVNCYLRHLKNYTLEGRVESRKALDLITPPNCLVNDMVSQYISHTEGWPMATMSVASYYNAFNRWRKSGTLSYDISDLVYMKRYVTPGQMSVFGDTLHVVCGTMKMSKPVKLTDKIMFFIRRDKITKIISNGDGFTIGLALEHYSNQRFDSAFSILRQLAYADKGNYMAQYWTAVMELQGVGCEGIDPEVRKQEALWWLNRGVNRSKEVLCSHWKKYRNRTGERISFTDYADTYGSSVTELRMPEAWAQMKQLLQDLNLTYANVNLGLWEGYDKVNAVFPPMNCGLMLKADSKGRLGYVDEKGKWVIKPRYSWAYPFSPDGYAQIRDCTEKFGFIDTRGKIVIPAEYDLLTHKFIGDIAFGIKNGCLCIIDKSNRLLCSLNGYNPESTYFELLDKYVVLFNKQTGKGDMYDRYGNIIEAGVDEVSCEPNDFMKVYKNGEIVYRCYEKW